MSQSYSEAKVISRTKCWDKGIGKIPAMASLGVSEAQQTTQFSQARKSRLLALNAEL